MLNIFLGPFFTLLTEGNQLAVPVFCFKFECRNETLMLFSFKLIF